MRRRTYTEEVLLPPRILARFFSYSIEAPELEAAGLLIGNIKNRTLVIHDVYLVQNAQRTATTVRIPHEVLSRVSRSLPLGRAVIGWIHSHPGYSVFMSQKDIRVQGGFQACYPDAIAIVMDPCTKGAIEFGLFRLQDKQVVEIPYRYG